MACLENSIFSNSAGYEMETFVGDCIEASQCLDIGDVNLDGTLNILDVVNLVNLILG